TSSRTNSAMSALSVLFVRIVRVSTSATVEGSSSATMARVTPGTWRLPGETAAVWPGRTWPLGASYDAEATNFAVRAPEAGQVWVCLFDEEERETRHPLSEVSLGIWHGAVPGVAPGTRYGYRADGPWTPAMGLRFNPDKLLLDPYARVISGH